MSTGRRKRPDLSKRFLGGKIYFNMPQSIFPPARFRRAQKISVRGPIIASFLMLILLLASVAVACILEKDRSRATVERIYSNELLGLSAVKQVNANVVHIDRVLGSMALARTIAERKEIAERLDGYRADMRKQLDVARPLFPPGRGHALFVAVELSVRRYEETIQEAMSRLAREEPGSGREGIVYLFDELRPRSYDAGDGLSELTRHKELVTEQYKRALSEDNRSNRTLMLALCAAGVVVGLGLSVPLACRSPAGGNVAGSIEPERRSLTGLVRQFARHAGASGKDVRGLVSTSSKTIAERAAPVERFDYSGRPAAWLRFDAGLEAARGRGQARLPNAADVPVNTPVPEGA